MILGYVKIVFIFLKNNKIYAGINLLGLSFALSVSFVILLFVINEYSYNHCYKNRDQIYTVVFNETVSNDSYEGSPFPFAEVLKDEIPQIEYIARERKLRGFKIKKGEEYISVNQAIASENEICKIFNLSVSNFNKESISDLNSILISKKIAARIFSEMNPVGEEITCLINGEEQPFIVKGVFDDLPVNSSFQADCLMNIRWTFAPIDKAYEPYNLEKAEVNWGFKFWNTWIMFKKGTNIPAIKKQLTNIGNRYKDEKMEVTYSLLSLNDIYLGAENINIRRSKGDLGDVYFYLCVALLIILVAASNYIILSIAISSGRVKEIGIRKTSGATVKNVQLQLLSESVLFALIIIPLAVFFAFAIKPFMENLLQIKLEIINTNIWIYITAYLVLAILIGIASGLYNSFYLSRLNVINIIKNKNFLRNGKSKVKFVLIVLQLVIFCSFFSATLIVYSQYEFALHKDMGYDKKDIVLINLGRDFKNYKAYINKLKGCPYIKSIGGTMFPLPMGNSMGSNCEHFKDKGRYVEIEGMCVDYGFIETMGLKIVQGRSFSADFGNDVANSIIVNEKAVKDLGIENPLGKQLEEKTIIGVVKDFNLHSIHTSIPPISITMDQGYVWQIAVAYQPGSLEKVVQFAKNKWDKDMSELPFSYKTIYDLDEEIYVGERKLNELISWVAFFVLSISVLGLFALTLFMTKSQTKEIGIKKTLGCSSTDFIYPYLKRNALLVLVASLLSFPITYYIMDKWLQKFSYKISIQPVFFVIAFALALLVVIVTIYAQYYKTFKSNPAEALQYE